MLPQISAYIRYHREYSVNALVQGILNELGVKVPAAVVEQELKLIRELESQRKIFNPSTASTNEFMAELRRLANEGPEGPDSGNRRGIRI